MLLVNEPQLSTGFRGLLWQPGSEMEVVFLFGLLLPHLDLPLAIDTVRDAFPDCLARRTDTGTDVRIEFELYSSNFKQHKHACDGCDLIVCWEDDWGGGDGFPDILALADVVRDRCSHLIASDRPKHPTQQWNELTFRQGMVDLKPRDRQLVERLLAFAKENRLGPRWVSGSYGAFVVRAEEEFFKVYNTGRIGFAWSRWKRRERLAELFESLNSATGVKQFTPEHANSKMGWQIGELLPTDQVAQQFLTAWAVFRNTLR